MLTDRQQTGVLGERIAARYLMRRGWTILAERYRCGHRDIDLIATRRDRKRGRMIAFVEVRTRRSALWGDPVATVRWKKQQEITTAARAWISSNSRSGDVYRFDVIGVLFDGTRTNVQHIPDAFWRRTFG
jgi:putative endonuclease